MEAALVLIMMVNTELMNEAEIVWCHWLLNIRDRVICKICCVEAKICRLSNLVTVICYPFSTTRNILYDANEALH